MAPVIVPSTDYLTWILPPKRIEPRQLQITLADNAKKVLSSPYCQTQVLALVQPVVQSLLFWLKRREFVQKERKRKKVPTWASIEEKLLCVKPQHTGGFFRIRLENRPNVPAKRYMLAIWQSSKILGSGELLARLIFKQWFKLQAQLQSRERRVSWSPLILPNSPSIRTNCEMALIRLNLRLQKSKLIFLSAKLWLRRQDGLAVAMEELLKSVMKMLYQNFWMNGDVMRVSEVINSEVKMAVSLILLKCINSSPKPITVNKAVRMNRLLKRGWQFRFTGWEVLLTTRFSLAQPQIHSTPNMPIRMKTPMTLLAVSEAASLALQSGWSYYYGQTGGSQILLVFMAQLVYKAQLFLSALNYARSALTAIGDQPSLGACFTRLLPGLTSSKISSLISQIQNIGLQRTSKSSDACGFIPLCFQGYLTQIPGQTLFALWIYYKEWGQEGGQWRL